jgi:pyroglutamyl-peptidase
MACRGRAAADRHGGALIVVVQGFGPFGSHTVNPSELLVRALGERTPADAGLVTEVLPTSMATVLEAVPELVARHRPSMWLGVGLAAGRMALSVEAVAVNLAAWPPQDADADGNAADRQPVVPGGPPAHLTTLPVEEILAVWKGAGIPGYVSLTAGSYLCNLSMYAAAQAAADLGLQCRVGFVHVPLLPELVDDPERQPSMSMSMQSEGLDLAIEAGRAAGAGSGLYLRRAAV